MTENKRSVHGEFVRADDAEKTMDIRILSYNTVDSYGTLWLQGCASESLAGGYLPLAWAHDRAEPIGSMVQPLGDDDIGPVVRFRLDNFDEVPMARRAYSQAKSGTLRDVSIGFSHIDVREPTEAEREMYIGVSDIVTRVTLDEVSLVMRGAVPSAQLLVVRAAPPAPVVDYSNVEAMADQALGGLGR